MDLGSGLPYLVDSVLGWFGKDSLSAEWKRKIQHLVKLSAEQAAFVQCVGMAKPVPITDIYQATDLIFPEPGPRKRPIGEVLSSDTDLVIFAGPGWGKTTLLHWLYVRLCHEHQDIIPFLFTLRWPKCPADLAEFVDHLAAAGNKGLGKDQKLILLVDGYDEISDADRKLVSRSLLLFKSLRIGNFYLTCRSFYNIYDLAATHCEIEPFSQSDALGFVRAFGKIYGVPLNAELLLSELNEHGFSDFAAHPLMLTLVCILRTGPNPDIPRRAIGLIRRAIDTLTLRWDEQKGIHRRTDIPLDGEERVRCLMRIAFGMGALQVPVQEVEKSAKDHLYLLQVKGVDVRRLLDELARWYGILVPVDAHSWQFVHRTIHDYLAARFWVESGGFPTAYVKEWNARAAYATCLLPDATQNLCRMLLEAGDIAAFAECLYNRAPFNPTSVANAVLRRVAERGRFTLDYQETHVAVSTTEDFFSLASEEFLRAMVLLGSQRGGDNGEVVALYALSEFSRRKLRFKSDYLVHHLQAIYCSNQHYPVQAYRNGAPYEFLLSDVIVR